MINQDKLAYLVYKTVKQSIKFLIFHVNAIFWTNY